MCVASGKENIASRLSADVIASLQERGESVASPLQAVGTWHWNLENRWVLAYRHTVSNSNPNGDVS